MAERDVELSQRLVIGHRRDGRRKYDAAAKRELVEACLRPGVSVAGMALRYGLNANLLRKWIDIHGRRNGLVAGKRSLKPPAEPAFRLLEIKGLPGAGASRLGAELPNGIRLDLTGLSRDELSQVLHMLGALPCSGSTRR